MSTYTALGHCAAAHAGPDLVADMTRRARSGCSTNTYSEHNSGAATAMPYICLGLTLDAWRHA
eukprot:356687-Chlamydomonas_euryale.AAC.1